MIRSTSSATLMLVGGLVASCGEENVAIPPAPQLVQTILVQSPATPKQRFTGVVRARTESSLGFRVGGKILERLVDPGEHVRRGQALMRLDRSDFMLSLGSAQAAVDAANAEVMMSSAEEMRTRKLVSAGWAAPKTYDQTKANADAAAARLTAAEAQAKQLGNQLLYAELQADADGVVMEVPVEPGQVVAAGQPVVKLARDGAREAEVFLPEGRGRSTSSEATARLYIDRDHTFPARLRELSAIADPATRTYRARYVLAGIGETAQLGSTVTVEIVGGLRGADKTYDVPLGAIFDIGEGTSVWKVDPTSNTVTAQPITITRLREEAAEIASGLTEGDRIVALGAHLLKPGQRVRLAASQVAAIGR